MLNATSNNVASGLDNELADTMDAVSIYGKEAKPSKNPTFSLSTSRRIMSVAHGIRTLGVLGAGQMGTGIALVAALRAKVPVLLHDRSPEQISRGLALMDKLLAKDVAKGRITSEQSKEARDLVGVVSSEAGLSGFRDVDMVIEVCATDAFAYTFPLFPLMNRQYLNLYHSSNPYSHRLQLSLGPTQFWLRTQVLLVSQRLLPLLFRNTQMQLAKRGKRVQDVLSVCNVDSFLLNSSFIVIVNTRASFL